MAINSKIVARLTISKKNPAYPILDKLRGDQDMIKLRMQNLIELGVKPYLLIQNEMQRNHTLEMDAMTNKARQEVASFQPSVASKNEKSKSKSNEEPRFDLSFIVVD
jgi:hypothetical protein